MGSEFPQELSADWAPSFKVSYPPKLLIALIGMPGGGKSTIGRHLAKRLSVPFVDSDAVIEQRIHESIRSYFEREGEERFRDLEQEVISELLQTTGAVLATGGGTVLRETNRQTLRDRSVVVYLRSTPEELGRRLRHDTQRPLLQGANPQEQLSKLFAERDPIYRQTAHFVVEAVRPSVSTLVNTIVMQLELAGVVGPAEPSSTNGMDGVS